MKMTAAAAAVISLSCFSFEVLFGQFENSRGQQKYGDQVGDGHKAVEGIGNAPDQAQINSSAHDGYQRVGDVEGQQDLAAE